MSKVLLVDNETSRATAMRESLERGGFETVTATDGNEGLKVFLNEVPDLVMVGPLAANPDEDFCRKMRDTRPGVQTPIILYCDSLGGDELKAALERSGCNVYLEVPTSDERLLEVCRHALVEAVGSVPAGASDNVATVAASVPAFTSPDAAVAELATSGRDIDDHLESMFETGEPPPATEWAAQPEISFETDMAEQPVEPTETDQAEEPVATLPVETDVPIAPTSPADAHTEAEAEVELVGFDSDEVAFEQEGDVDPGIQPDVASEAQSLVQSPVQSDASDADTAYVPEPPVADAEPFDPPGIVHVDADTPAAGSVDFTVDESARHDESPSIELMAEPDTGSSRGWLWGLVAAAVLVGVAMFSIFRPSGDTTPIPATSRSTAATAAVADDPAPTVATQPALGNDTSPAEDIDPGVVDTANAFPTVGTGEAADPPTGEVPSALTNASAVTTPETNSDSTPTADDEASDLEEAAARAAMIAAERTNPGPGIVSVPARPAPAEVATTPAEPRAATSQPDTPKPAPSKPNPEAHVVFQPSTEIVDAATAGEGFTAPRSINRNKPAYNASDVPAGGETVVLRVLVNDWGKAVRVDVEQGNTGSPLVNAAIDAVLNTRYRPADVRGRQVRAWATETFVFE